jgi:hypothetical protein
LLPQDEPLRTLERANKACALHLSLCYITLRWGLGWLAKLNSVERAKLKELVGKGADREDLATFYGGSSNNQPTHRGFRIKAALEKAIGRGLNPVLKRLVKTGASARMRPR